jgi:hypothetical protein
MSKLRVERPAVGVRSCQHGGMIPPVFRYSARRPKQRFPPAYDNNAMNAQQPGIDPAARASRHHPGGEEPEAENPSPTSFDADAISPPLRRRHKPTPDVIDDAERQALLLLVSAAG